MKIIDLLNKIANGEEVPSKIKFDDIIFEYDGDYYSSKTNALLEEYCHLTTSLNDEVEIIEEQKKIPEKLKIEQDTPNSNYYIRNEHGTKCALTKHSKMIVETLNEIIDTLEMLNGKIK